MALVVERSTLNGMTTLSVQDSNRIFLIIGGSVALTILINGTASNTVLNALGLATRTTEVFISNDYLGNIFDLQYMRCFKIHT